MPYLKLETNVKIDQARAETLLAQLSRTVAEITGKPEKYVQVDVSGGRNMYCSGNNEPTAHVQVKGIGFAEKNAAPLSAAVAEVLDKELGIPADRIYMPCQSYSGSMWGFNKATF
ncbi:MAG: hypothetical protein LIP23_02045 [Planctomycetes bacterium]|nr:hypothetical protein [Planctomycetota bacterium]